ncbi:MAG: hypothetical protein ACYTG1_12095 [Planctomycetota bacterium]|jgi:hypothetical protein
MRLILLGLLLGLLTAPAVAWACCLWAPVATTRTEPAAADDPAAADLRRRARAVEVRRTRSRGAGWDAEILIGAVADEPDAVAARVSAGWPWRCFTGEQEVIGGRLRRDGAAAAPAGAGGSRADRVWIIPLRPAWAGLAGCVLFFAAAWVLPLGAVAAWARRRDRRRPSCPSCGVRLRAGDSRCPSCRTPV